MVDPTPPAVPDGYATVTAMVIVTDADALLRFWTEAFDTRLRGDVFRMPDGTVAHAEVLFGDSVVMASEATDEFPANRCGLHLYLPDVDAAFARAVAAGAHVQREPHDEFYGDRSAVVTDRWGIVYSLASHVEDVDDEEMARRLRDVTSG